LPWYGGLAQRRYGGGIRGSATNTPLLERVQESLAAQMGTAYEASVNPITSAVGMETMAYARAITFDGYGASERMVRELYPPTATLGGLLPRWEAIMGTPPVLGDTQVTRQARVAAKWLQVATGARVQEVTDALQAALGPLFGSLVHQDPSDALAFWPGGSPPAPNQWTSTIAVLNVGLNVPPSYVDPSTGAPNAAWWAASGGVQTVLDPMLPIWMQFQSFVLSSHGTVGWYLDEPDLDLEIFDV